MDYKKTNAPATTVTRDMMELCADTGNVYETVAIIGKRANQISVEIKNDLSKKLALIQSLSSDPINGPTWFIYCLFMIKIYSYIIQRKQSLYWLTAAKASDFYIPFIFHHAIHDMAVTVM